jgi:hypothetical protein
MKKVTEEQLKQIQTLRERLVEIVTTIGELHLTRYMTERQLHTIDDDIKLQQNKFAEFQNEERVLFETLQQQYGTGNIDFETGEIVE